MQKSVFQMLLDVKTRGSNNIRRLGRDLQGVQGKAKNLASSFAGLSKPLIALAGIGGGAALLKSIFGTAAELESQTRSLEVLTGSAEKTSQILAEIKAFGAATPFQVRELIDVTKKLKAFGIETDSLVDTTRRLGDVAGATGAELDGIATAFGQIRAKGKFQQEENLQLLERGVDLTTELKEMYGLSGDELAKAMTKGQISFDAANQALIRLTSQGGTYFGGAIAQADTLNGKLSTLQDAFITLGQNIGKVLEPIFKSIIDFLTVLTNQINNLFREAEIANKVRGEFGLDTTAGRQKLKRMSVAERRQFFKDIAAREEELRQTDFGMDRLRPDAKTPLLLKQLTGGKVTKEAVQASDEMRQILEQINVARVAGNEFQLAGLEFDREMLRIQEEALTGNNLAIAQSSALADFDLKRQQLLSGTTEKQKELNKETDKYKITLDQVKDTLANQMTSAIEGLIDGTKSLKESLSGLLRQFGSMFLRAGMGSLVNQIFASAKGNVFAQNGIVPYAKGGYIGKPTMALMGEAGPEAVLPLRRGRGGRLGVETSGGGIGDVVVNVDASGSSVQGDQPNASQLGKAIGAAVQAELIKQRRPGGLLTR